MSKAADIQILSAALNKVAECAKETLWPTSCAICNTPGQIICKKCLKNLQFIDPKDSCKTCYAPYGISQCTECNDVVMNMIGMKKFPLQGIISCTILDDKAKRIITVYKDENERRLAKFIAKCIAQYIPPELLELNPCLTYIPATKAAYNRRGFDHAGEITELVAKEIKLECKPLFMRPKAFDQRHLGRRARVENMADNIRIKNEQEVHSLYEKFGCLIIVDDVCTTGSTIFAAANAVQNAGFTNIYGATFGRVLA